MVDDKNYLPWYVVVEKDLSGKVQINSQGGILSDMEKEVFSFCTYEIILKNYKGREINYFKKKDFSIIDKKVAFQKQSTFMTQT